MVGTATGAGGAGSLSIKGSLDTSLIERGFTRMKKGFEGVKGQASSFNADLSRMSKGAGRLTKGLLAIGIAGTTAMIGLASQAPAVAGAMARISIQTDRLSRTLGQTFRPEFEAVANLYEKFVNFAEGHPAVFKAFAGMTAGLALAGVAEGAAKLAGLFGITVSASVITALGYMAAIAGLGYGIVKISSAIGKGLGAEFKIGEGTQVPLTEAAKTQISTASPEELAYLSSKYGDRTTGGGYGPEQTAQIDLETGELYSMQHLARDITRQVSADPGFQDAMAHLMANIDIKNLDFSATNTLTP